MKTMSGCSAKDLSSRGLRPAGWTSVLNFVAMLSVRESNAQHALHQPGIRVAFADPESSGDALTQELDLDRFHFSA